MRKFIDFTAMRIVCAVLTYGLYLLLLRWIGYEAAYFVAYLVGIVLAYVTNALIVFNQPLNRKSAFLFPLTYIVQFLLGWAVLRASVEMAGVPEWLALGISTILTLPVTYVMSKWAILKR